MSQPSKRRGQTPGIVAPPLPERKPLRWRARINASAYNQHSRAPRPHGFFQMNSDGQSASLRLLFLWQAREFCTDEIVCRTKRRPELKSLAMLCGGALWEYIEFLRGAKGVATSDKKSQAIIGDVPKALDEMNQE